MEIWLEYLVGLNAACQNYAKCTHLIQLDFQDSFMSFNELHPLIKVDVDETFASTYMNVLVHGDGIIY